MAVISEGRLNEYRSLLVTMFRDSILKLSAQLKAVKEAGHNYLGDDIDAHTLGMIDKVINHPETVPDLSRYERAQLQELAFWRYVAFEGYAGNDPRCFTFMQRLFMVNSFMATGWSIAELAEASIVEIGCGPLGMVEYLPARRRVGFDPLNKYYSQLFSRERSPQIEYVQDLDALVQAHAGSFDLAICFNVLDHTTEPKGLFESYMALVKPGGRFIFQLNTVQEAFPRSQEHTSMHPSPFTAEQIRDWLAAFSSDYESQLAAEPSHENEFFFMAWGHKDRGGPVPSDPIKAS